MVLPLAALLALPAGAVAAARTVPLVEAAKHGDIKLARLLVAQKVNVNAPDVDGSTALHWAAHRGDVTLVDVLLQAGAKAATVNAYGVTPLALGVESGEPGVVSRLIKAGADANAATTGGETVLMTASRLGKAEAVKVLLEHGAQVNATETTRGQTALMWAAAEGHADVVRLLLQKGADINATSRGPASPKDITEGASIYKRVAPRIDPFKPVQFAVRAGHLEATKALVEAGANVNEATVNGMSLLTLAIANAAYDTASYLIDTGADVNDARPGWTPLIQVVRVRNLNIGQFPHPVTKGRMTSSELAQKLLKAGAQVDGLTEKAFNDGWRGFFGPKATAFLLAAKGGDTEMMRLLAEHGADVFHKNATGSNAVMVAAGVDMFNPNEDSGTDAEGLAALKLALELGKGKFDVNELNRSGEAALHGAMHRNSTEIVRVLVEAGAKLDLQNKKGLTAIQIANGEDNFIGMIGRRQELIDQLSGMMLAQGLTPQLRDDAANRFNFGVKAKQ
ncbi:MAG: ankyrin repeat domain-containing protein [Vicinamibacterales bacterium]|nr:ankyrin repeat domain-containing protein [Vicinamibacterales bacterium]